MSEPRRLLDEGTSELGLLLLGSASLDRVPAGALERAAERLGVGAAALEVAVATQASAGTLGASCGLADAGPNLSGHLADAAGHAGNAAQLALRTQGTGAVGLGVSTTPGATALGALKVLLISVVSAAALVGGGYALVRRLGRVELAGTAPPPPEAQPMATTAQVVPPARGSGTEAAPVDVARESERASLAPPHRARPTSELARARAVLPVASGSDAERTPSLPSAETSRQHARSALALELAALDRARGALARGAPESALAQLEAYEQLPGDKALASEAATLRVEALRRAGRRDEAAGVAARALADGATGHGAIWLEQVVRERRPGDERGGQ